MLVRDLIRSKSRLKKTVSIRLFDKPALTKADGVQFTTERERSDCDALGIRPRRSIVVPNGVDLNDIPLALRSGQRNRRPAGSILYFGRINWKKRIDRVIAALKALPESTLVIAGNDEEHYRDTLESIARESGVADRVEFRGAVEDENKWALLAESSVLVLPSISENFGNVVLEAMAVGTPVVVTTGVGLAEAVHRAGAGLVSGADPEALAESIGKVLGASDRGRSMGDSGRVLVAAEYSWDRVAERMEAAYSEIIDSRAGIGHGDALRGASL
jgi:glycosyltransferase involved in cell wall biosynthesis